METSVLLALARTAARQLTEETPEVRWSAAMDDDWPGAVQLRARRPDGTRYCVRVLPAFGGRLVVQGLLTENLDVLRRCHIEWPSITVTAIGEPDRLARHLSSHMRRRLLPPLDRSLEKLAAATAEYEQAKASHEAAVTRLIAAMPAARTGDGHSSYGGYDRDATTISRQGNGRRTTVRALVNRDGSRVDFTHLNGLSVDQAEQLLRLMADILD